MAEKNARRPRESKGPQRPGASSPGPSATYLALVEHFPLVPVRDERQHAAALAEIDRLLRQDLDEGGEDYRDALTELVGVYEGRHVPIPDASEADVLRELMASNRLTRGRLAGEVGVSQSTIAAVLNGTRSLTRVQVGALARYFRVSPSVFFPE